jgi:uncharacterized protein (UPF0276 family)
MDDTAFGIGWRHAHYGALLEGDADPGLIEVHSENFFGDGGAALAVLEQGRARWPVSLHGVGLGLGSACGIDVGHLERLARLVDRIEPLRVSDHACFARVPMRDAVVHAADLLPLPFNEEALLVLVRNVQQVQERIGRRLLVENLSAYLTLSGADRSEPQFLGELASRSGCGLLVDVNNLYVNALNAQRRGDEGDPEASCLAWIDGIDPAAVAEIHVAGHCETPDIVIDDHGARTSEAVWRIYERAVARFGCVPTVIEWDTNLPGLEVLLDERKRAREHAIAALRPPKVRG